MIKAHEHCLRLSLVLGHPFRIFACAGLQYECADPECDYKELENLADWEKRKDGYLQDFCGLAPAVLRRGCSCGRITPEEIEAFCKEAKEWVKKEFAEDG